MTSEPGKDSGLIYTFYSYKGGVGRSMAVANVGALLARFGKRVLIVDWDLEAPGIESYFDKYSPQLIEQRRRTPGVVDLICARGNGQELNWRNCILQAYAFGADHPISIITAGQSDATYIQRVQTLNLPNLFEKKALGTYLEALRREWKSEFDSVLIDSRTGITDIGGICTIHLPDVLVLFFTTNNQSVDGVIDVTNKARAVRSELPVDRSHLVAVPVPARDESRTEYREASAWKQIFAERFADFYKDWLPQSKKPSEALEILRIPYIPYWSFGERLPVVEEGDSDPASLASAYEVLARLIASQLQWEDAMQGFFLSPPVAISTIPWNKDWFRKHRENALAGIRQSGKDGFMELCFAPLNTTVEKDQAELLRAAESAQIHTFGWPIGVVLSNRDDARPHAFSDGIAAEIKGKIVEQVYDYWALSRKGEFYLLRSLFEDDRGQNVIFFDTRIVQITEALMYCKGLYRRLGLPVTTSVRLVMTYSGLKGRFLSSAGPGRFVRRTGESRENDVTTQVEFSLGDVDKDLMDLVKNLAEQLFVLFDFSRFEPEIYTKIVKDFIAGKV
jgi:cellulose biosynthesis protein BcsQ